MQKIILVVEEDSVMRDMIASQLRGVGYFVLVVPDGGTAVEIARYNPLSLIIFDLMSLKRNGLTICQQLRVHTENADVPILAVVRNDSEILNVERPLLGVHDYIVKPFAWEEFLARVRTLLRGNKLKLIKHKDGGENDREGEEVLVADDLHIDIARHKVNRGEQLLDINHPLLFDLLVYLVQHRGIVVTRDQLLTHVWGYHMNNSRTVDVHVRWLRQKLEDDPDNPRLIQTVRGVGYRFGD